MEQLQNFSLLVYYLSQGVGVTLGVTVIALSTGFVFGTLLGLMRVYGGPLLGGFAATYSMVIRGIQVIVVLFILFFVIAQFINLSPFLAGAIALGIASSAYQSEIFRGAFMAVPPGQMMAARAIGMSRIKAILFVILPQALRLAIPPWSNEAAIVLKDSSLVYVLGVPEILRRAQYVSARTHEPFIAFAAAALLYFILTFLTNRGLDVLERRYRLQM
jgi:polar amino acid transport system permease protein